MLKRILLIIGTLITGAACAEPPSDVNGFGWKGGAELGVVDTSGNRETTTINAKLNAVHEAPKWRNKFESEYLQASDNLGMTARRTVGQAATNYKLDEDDYLFGNLRYENDEFAAYDYRVSETVGYGHRFRWDGQRLDLEAGVGGSHTRFVNEERENDAIVRLAAAYLWKFSESGEFSENVFSEIGAANTHSESETALKLKVIGQVAMKLSYKVLYNSQVPAGIEDTDSITAVTLVYDF